MIPPAKQILVPLAIVLAAAVVAGAGSVRADDPVTPRDKPIALFNGKDLTGLYTWLVDTKRDDPRKVFTVADGVIRISGDGLGYLATEKDYADYRLVVEFKWGGRNHGERIGKARDSGIFLHATGPDGNSYDGKGAFMAAIECNVMEGAVGDFLLIKGKDAAGRNIPLRVSASAQPKRDADGWPTWQSGGKSMTLDNGGRVNWEKKAADWRDVFAFRGRDDVESKAGDWTKVECICRGETITIVVNGTKVNEVTDVKPSRGKVLLQCEGSEVFFRTFEVHPLDQKDR